MMRLQQCSPLLLLPHAAWHLLEQGAASASAPGSARGWLAGCSQAVTQQSAASHMPVGGSVGPAEQREGLSAV